jgi:hypothetical protein
MAQKRPLLQETDAPGAKVMACAAATTESASRSLASIVVCVETINRLFKTVSFLEALAVSPSHRTSTCGTRSSFMVAPRCCNSSSSTGSS